MPVRFNKPGIWSPVLDLDLSDKTKVAIKKMIALAYEEQDDTKPSYEQINSELEDGQSSILTSSRDHSTATDTNVQKEMQDFMELPPKHSSGDILVSSNSMQKLQAYPIETTHDPVQDMIVIDRISYHSTEVAPSSAEEVVSQVQDFDKSTSE